MAKEMMLPPAKSLTELQREREGKFVKAIGFYAAGVAALIYKAHEQAWEPDTRSMLTAAFFCLLATCIGDNEMEKVRKASKAIKMLHANQITQSNILS